MKEARKFPAWMVIFAVWMAVLFVLPDGFPSFILGFVGGGMIAINAGEQLRKDRERRSAA